MTDTIAKALNTLSVYDPSKDTGNQTEVYDAVREDETLETDFQLARDTIIGSIQTASEALANLGGLAQQSQSPRAYEVIATLSKTLGDMSKDLVSLHKAKKAADPVFIDKSSTTINNTLFAGSTQDLQRYLKELENE